MPVLVQWKWEEKTKTYLVIFHFLDTYDEPNLRMKNTYMVKGKYSYKKMNVNRPKPTPIMTWAPSHPELGLLSEVLSYANIINGLDYDKKVEIQNWLEGEVFFLTARIKDERITFLCSVTNLELLKASELCQLINHSREEGRYYRCFKLTPEYIEYLKKGLIIEEAIDVREIIPFEKMSFE